MVAKGLLQLPLAGGQALARQVAGFTGVFREVEEPQLPGLYNVASEGELPIRGMSGLCKMPLAPVRAALTM